MGAEFCSNVNEQQTLEQAPTRITKSDIKAMHGAAEMMRRYSKQSEFSTESEVFKKVSPRPVHEESDPDEDEGDEYFIYDQEQLRNQDMIKQ